MPRNTRQFNFYTCTFESLNVLLKKNDFFFSDRDFIYLFIYLFNYNLKQK